MKLARLLKECSDSEHLPVVYKEEINVDHTKGCQLIFVVAMNQLKTVRNDAGGQKAQMKARPMANSQ